MARIYFNCPFSTTNGNNIYKMWKWIIFILAVSAVIFVFSWPRIFNLSESSISQYPETFEELHYGIVIDCGSSGSRVFVYYWPTHSGNPRDLLRIQQLLDSTGKVVVKKLTPGLSSFEDNPDAASDHIKELLLYAQSYIPPHKHPETLLYVLATAGMRMLSESAQKAILTDLREDIKKDFNFVAPENHFEVISGKQEGVYAWIAINYALDRFSHSTSLSATNPPTVSIEHSVDGETPVTHSRKRTVGMIDMGGGSVQIAFEVTDLKHSKNIPGALLSEFNLGCQDTDIEHTYRVYVTTFLGYGANSARERYENMLINRAAARGRPTSVPVMDTCLPKDMTLRSEDEAGKTHDFLGTGDFEACKTEVEPLLNLTVSCSQRPCSLNGIHQPHIDLSSQFYGFSEFWYSMEDVFRMGGKYDYNKFLNKAKDFCSTKWSTLQGWYSQKYYPKADDHRFKFQCFKSAWVTQVFHKGFSFPTEYDKLLSAQLVNGKDVGWTLGALLFKTRFLPLRVIERLQNHEQTYNWRSSHLDASFLLVACFLVVVAAIVVYMKWLKCCPHKGTLTRVPSLSYFMTEEDQLEQGVQLVKGQGYIL